MTTPSRSYLRQFWDRIISWTMAPYTVYIGPGTYTGEFKFPEGVTRIQGAGSAPGGRRRRFTRLHNPAIKPPFDIDSDKGN